MRSNENKNKTNQKHQSAPIDSDDKKYPDKKDFFERGQGKREKAPDDDSGIVVKPSNPESQEWHARESVSNEGSDSEISQST